MGQGFSLTTLSPGTAGIDVPELADLVYEKSMGTAQFMKSIRARHHEGVVLVKVVVKPWTMKLEPYKRKIIAERKALADVPNALACLRAVETDTNGFLVRQYLYSSLYDRLSTRPFLEDIEKKWLAFQLLCGIRDCHARNVYHGDIKTENVLVTSWNWLYLADFSSSFKPTTLPEDNPADFSYFFDTGGRRTCYLAPERFRAAGEPPNTEARITGAMDIFSGGCVIAELFLEVPVFNLSQLYKYRKGEYDPAVSHLSRIANADLRDMIISMIQVNPASRYTAEEYLNMWRKKVFPDYFYSFLQQYMGMITDSFSGRRPEAGVTAHLGDCDDRIDRVYFDFDKISFFLGYESEEHQQKNSSCTTSGLELIPVNLDIPNNEHPVSALGKKSSDDGTLIFLSLVVSSIRNTARATAKLRACDLLLAFSERLKDEAKLDRVLPYLVALLNDNAAIVRVATIRTITQLLAMITVVSPVNAHVFPEYILPRMQSFLGPSAEPEPFVRATYAACLGSLASSASHFLDIVSMLQADGSLLITDPESENSKNVGSSFEGIFDDARVELIEIFAHHTKTLMTDSDSAVKRAFLGSVPELCMFFGVEESNDIILSHLNTYLNDRDWMLKCAFFETIVGVATFLGGSSLEEFILPLMIQALTDSEEFVIKSVLQSLANMADLGLFQRPTLWKLIGMVIRFSMHPNVWIREAAVTFISSSTRFLSIADNHCIVLPLIKPYLKTWIKDFCELGLLDHLKKPLSRPLLDLSVVWASKAEKGIFWRRVHQMHTFSLDSNNTLVPALSDNDSTCSTLQRVSRNEEDDQWISKLRNMGLKLEDDFKLLCLREYIWRQALLKSRNNEAGPIGHNDIVKLHTINITPHTVMFDDKHHPNVEGLFRSVQNGTEEDYDRTPRTIADALLDASISINDSISRKSFSTNNNSKKALRQLENSPTRNNQQEHRSTSVLSSSPAENRNSEEVTHASNERNRNEASLLPESETGLNVRDRNRCLRSKTSAISLMSREDSAKTFAKATTTSTNAFGKVEGPLYHNLSEQSKLAFVKEQKRTYQYQVRFRGAHNYTGNDPNILKMLDAMYAENYLNEAAEFGPMILPSSRRKTHNKFLAQGADKPWRPEGKMVTMFSEHTGPLNHVAVAPDHVFFLTGGDDGCVKVWDTARLERDITNRSRQTYTHGLGAKITGLCFIENTHSFVSCASNGSIKIVRVSPANNSGTMKYEKLRLLREFQLPKGEIGIFCYHFKLETSSTLLVATNRSRILAIDPRKMEIQYTLDNPVHHGTTTCFVVDKKKQWILLGTSHGVLDLWDLRFKVRLKAWGIPGATAISQMNLHPTRGRGKWVCIAGGSSQGEVTVWDVEKAQCREVYRAGGTRGLKGYDPWPVDEDRPEGMLGRFATTIQAGIIGNSDRGVRAMISGSSGHDDNNEGKHGFIITGGADKKIRFWDVFRIDQSMIVSGLDAEDLKPSFSAAHPTTSLVLNTELLPNPTTPSAPNAGSRLSGSTKPTNGRPPRSTVISLQQQQLLRSHLDSILNIALLESPYNMIVSVDRSGVCFVFQ
ncbi:Serine/threonine-protein kinase [Podosphaera aphanis]|nr:Serine/threonine-protein kinase [Podosphaera aphanis]